MKRLTIMKNKKQNTRCQCKMKERKKANEKPACSLRAGFQSFLTNGSLGYVSLLSVAVFSPPAEHVCHTFESQASDDKSHDDHDNSNPVANEVVRSSSKELHDSSSKPVKAHADVVACEADNSRTDYTLRDPPDKFANSFHVFVLLRLCNMVFTNYIIPHLSFFCKFYI